MRVYIKVIYGCEGRGLKVILGVLPQKYPEHSEEQGENGGERGEVCGSGMRIFGELGCLQTVF